jgi:hypothetical protein
MLWEYAENGCLSEHAVYTCHEGHKHGVFTISKVREGAHNNLKPNLLLTNLPNVRNLRSMEPM